MDAYALKKHLLARSWTLEDLVEASLVSKQTAQRISRGGETRMSTLKDVAAALGVRPLDLVDRSEYKPVEEDQEGLFEGEWQISEPLGPMQTASNGLVYRRFRMRHRHQVTRAGWGKRYELFETPTDEKERLRAQLTRHMEVCDQVECCAFLPTCFTTYPEPDTWVWWVIDEWVDGETLAERLDRQPATQAEAARWALQAAEGIHALHQAGVVRRELNPGNVLVRDSDQSLLLTDFELAKLCGDGPTVSDQWPDDPYRAPEVGVSPPTPAADVYSWGRLVTHLVARSLPAREAELEALQSRVTSRVAKLVAACTLLPPSDRPQGMEAILPTVRRWATE